jgi:hypothetical protein
MMAIPTLVISLLLILTGVGGYFLGHPAPGATAVSPTALIPAWVGLTLGILGAISFNEKVRKHVMHLAAMVGLLAAIGDAMQLIKTINNTTTPADIRQMKIISMSITLVLCVVFLVLCIRSFINARKNRARGQ